MATSLRQNLHRAMVDTKTQFDAETLERVGRCVAAFVAAEARGVAGLHPETYIIDLPVQDHEAARACFDMLELLRAIDP